MIQRKQTLFLLIAAICSLLLFFLPSVTLIPAAGLAGDSYSLSALKTMIISTGSERELMSNWSLLTTNSIIMILYFATIFNYRKRLQQVKMCNFILLLQTVLILLFLYQEKQLIAMEGKEYVTEPGLGTAFIAAAMILVFLSRHFILRDEALVRSADRLR